MKAVATMTPDPKNLAKKKHHCGSLIKEYLEDNIGKKEPKPEDIKSMNTANILKLSLPS